MKHVIVRCFVFLLIAVGPGTSWGWDDKTHIAIPKLVGYASWYNGAGPDVTKIKAGALEEKNHYFDNNNNIPVTPGLVLDQIARYNDPHDEEGHLYGAIIAALREYRKTALAGKYAEYHMAFALHYICDLSQPLHNIAYDNFNKTHHSTNDGIVEDKILDNLKEVQKNMYQITLRQDHFEEDLAREIARIAELSRKFGLKLRAENRDMTKEEAYVQLGHSASLMRAVLKNVAEAK